MPLPAQTFPQHDMTSLLNYINTKIIPNGQELIIGEIHNNVENGLAQFILQSILNYYKATVISTGGALVLNTPITYIVNSTPTSLSWIDDNWFNEFYVINTTGNDINFVSGYSYYDEFAAAKTTLGANTILHIAKTANGSWIKVGSGTSGGSSATSFSAEYIQFTVGDSSTNPPLNAGENTFTVTDTNVVEGSVMLFLSGQKMPIGDNTQPYSYTISYQPTGFAVTFYADVENSMQFEINYFKTAVPPSSAGLTGTVLSITGANFEGDGITYINTALDNYYLQILWNDVSKMLIPQVQWDYQPGGGFYINYPGFDANLNPDYSLFIFVGSYMI